LPLFIVAGLDFVWYTVKPISGNKFQAIYVFKPNTLNLSSAIFTSHVLTTRQNATSDGTYKRNSIYSGKDERSKTKPECLRTVLPRKLKYSFLWSVLHFS
jgi:hypothetical protein